MTSGLQPPLWVLGCVRPFAPAPLRERAPLPESAGRWLQGHMECRYVPCLAIRGIGRYPCPDPDEADSRADG